MNAEREITLIGATGNLGVPVVNYLAGFGFRIKVVARNVEKARQLFKNLERISIVYADLKNTESLKKALRNTKTLYLNLSSNTTDVHIDFAPEREGMANVLEAIDRESIRQVLAISGLGAMENIHENGRFEFIPNIIRKQGHKLLKQSGIPYTILHCSWFADSFMLYRRKGIYTVLGDTQAPIYFTNGYDYSRQLVKAIGNGAAMFKEFPIQGKEGVGHLEAARRFLAIAAPETKVQPLPAFIIAVMALFNKELKLVKHMHTYFKRNTESYLGNSFQSFDILGKPELSLEDYAKKISHEGFYEALHAYKDDKKK